MSVQIQAGVHAAALLSGNVAAMAQAVACASAACLAEVRDQLIAAGEIKIEDEPELEDIEPDDDDAEMDLGDEDEWRDDDDAVGDGQPSPDDTPLFRKGAFEIRVTEADGGMCQCDVPQSGWEGVVGVTGYGKEAVKQVSLRMQVYFHIAMWLEENHQNFLQKGPRGFTRPLCTQRKLLGGPLKKVLGGSKDGGASSLSRYLGNVDLVWPEGALPLRKCFGD